MEKKIIKTGISLSRAIEKIISETTLNQRAQMYAQGVKEMAAQKAEAEENLNEEDVTTDDKEEEVKQPVSSKTQEDEKDKLKKGDIEPKDIIDKLNSIRSGKSFKDESVSSKLDEYIESLSKAEKVALLAFLKGISQVVTGEIDPRSAVEPSDAPASVKMDKQVTGKKKVIKPVVVKAPQKSEKKTSAEDTSGPVPITPKQ